MNRRWDRRTLTRYAIGAFYLLAGWQHLANPAPFVAITPDWVPIAKGAVVFWTGIIELLGAALLLAWKAKARAVGAMMRSTRWRCGPRISSTCFWTSNAPMAVSALPIIFRGLRRSPC